MEGTTIMETIMNLINNGLFPIAMCGGLIYVLVKIFDAYKEDHKAMVEAVNNNTLTMQKLCDRIENLADKEK